MPTVDKNGGSRWNTDSTPLANPTVLLKTIENENGSSNNNTSKFNKFSSPKQHKVEVSSGGKDRSDDLPCTREKF